MPESEVTTSTVNIPNWLRSALISASIAAPVSGFAANAGAGGLPQRLSHVEERVQALEQTVIAAAEQRTTTSRRLDDAEKWRERQDDRIREFYTEPFATLKSRLSSIETSLDLLLDGAAIQRRQRPQ